MDFLGIRWWWRWRWELGGLAAGLLCGAPGQAQCASADSSAHVVSVRKDVLLGSSWGVTVRCDHPEWPARMTPLSTGADGVEAMSIWVSPAAEIAVRVRVGESVRLWREDEVARIETVGTAEESGGEGQRVRVRLLRGASDTEAKVSVVGVVRGKGNVEIVR